MSAPGMPDKGLIALQVAPSVVETVVQLGKAEIGGKGFVVVWVHTPSGVTQVFLDPDAAERIGEAMAQAGKHARIGLHVAGNGGLGT